MTKLTPAHLRAFAQAFRAALERGEITIADAREFGALVDDAVLDDRVQTRNGRNPRGNDGTQKQMEFPESGET